MYDMYNVLLILILTFVVSILFTNLVRYLSVKIGAVDEPNSRRLNTVAMPSSGGLAIYASYFLSVLFLLPINRSLSVPIFIGATIIVFTGLIDDIKGISPKMKILGIVLATLAIYYLGDIQINRIDIPFYGIVQLGYFSLPITLLWVTAITNSINLIDGLDGLATGVSSISLVTMGIIAYFFIGSNNIQITIMIFALVAAAVGFLPANYFPAKIYLGDTGALFLGFMISVFSLFHLKNVTFFSLIVPLVILAVPIADTLYAIIRRKLNKQPISVADNKHIHHQLMNLGFTHKEAVKLLYTMTIAFSFIALLFPVASELGAVLLTIGFLLVLQFSAELLGLVGENGRPLTRLTKKLLSLFNRDIDQE